MLQGQRANGRENNRRRHQHNCRYNYRGQARRLNDITADNEEDNAFLLDGDDEERVTLRTQLEPMFPQIVNWVAAHRVERQPLWPVVNSGPNGAIPCNYGQGNVAAGLNAVRDRHCNHRGIGLYLNSTS